jgi:hypothetical protein
VSECGGFTAAVPGLANIQPVKPATKKKNMSAIVATAKLRSARRDRSHPFVDGLAFIPICARVSVPDRSDDGTCPPIFPGAPEIRSGRRIGALSVCPNLLEFGLRFLQKHHPWLACHSQTGWRRAVI